MLPHSKFQSGLLRVKAAVADYRPAEPLAAKRPKNAERWTIELEATEDVLLAVADALPRNGQVRVAFGAELGAEGLERKRRMLASKSVDLVTSKNFLVMSEFGVTKGMND